MSVLPGTAQRIRSRAECAAQRERGQPGRAEQVVQRLRALAGPPEPEAEDQARDEVERREQCLETGDACMSSSAFRTVLHHTGFFLTLAQRPVSLIPPFFFFFFFHCLPLSHCVCVCRRYHSYGPWWTGRRVIWSSWIRSFPELLVAGLIPAKRSSTTRRTRRTRRMKQTRPLEKVRTEDHRNLLKVRFLGFAWLTFGLILIPFPCSGNFLA